MDGDIKLDGSAANNSIRGNEFPSWISYDRDSSFEPTRSIILRPVFFFGRTAKRRREKKRSQIFFFSTFERFGYPILIINLRSSQKLLRTYYPITRERVNRRIANFRAGNPITPFHACCRRLINYERKQWTWKILQQEFPPPLFICFTRRTPPPSFLPVDVWKIQPFGA